MARDLSGEVEKLLQSNNSYIRKKVENFTFAYKSVHELDLLVLIVNVHHHFQAMYHHQE